MMWDWHDSAMFWWMAAGSVFWGVVVAAGIYLMTRALGHNGAPRPAAPTHKTEPSLHNARNPFAADEISDAELARIREKLSR